MAQLQMRLREVRIESDSLSCGIGRRHRITGRGQYAGQVDQGLDEVGQDVQRVPDKGDRPVQVTAFLQNQAQEIERIRLVWIVPQNRTITGFRLPKVTLPMPHQRCIE